MKYKIMTKFLKNNRIFQIKSAGLFCSEKAAQKYLDRKREVFNLHGTSSSFYSFTELTEAAHKKGSGIIYFVLENSCVL